MMILNDQISFFCYVNLLIIILTSVGEIWTARFENHFGNPCQFCGCFVEYSDRDVTISTLPYRMSTNSYNITEDKCLASCIHDERCKLVVYGFVGGREVFTCEFYNLVNVQKPIYVPFTNIYVKRLTPCQKEAYHIPGVFTKEEDDSKMSAIIARKNRYIKLSLQQNPFNFG